jgi:hypothetical protein
MFGPQLSPAGAANKNGLRKNKIKSGKTGNSSPMKKKMKKNIADRILKKKKEMKE